jgi:curved DNA-binding protein CbpA
VADAYYVLSDPTRRKEYDTLYASHDPSSSSNFFAAFANMFASSGAGTTAGTGLRPDADRQFADVFEEVQSTFVHQPDLLTVFSSY